MRRALFTAPRLINYGHITTGVAHRGRLGRRGLLTQAFDVGPDEVRAVTD